MSIKIFNITYSTEIWGNTSKTFRASYKFNCFRSRKKETPPHVPDHCKILARLHCSWINVAVNERWIDTIYRSETVGMLELDAFGGAGRAGACPAEGSGTQPQSRQRRVAGALGMLPGTVCIRRCWTDAVMSPARETAAANTSGDIAAGAKMWPARLLSALRNKERKERK